MSKVVLVINGVGNARMQTISILRKHFNVHLPGLLEAIDQNQPVLQQTLFSRNDPSFPERLIVALEDLERLGVQHAAFELSDNQCFAGMSRDLLYQITPQRLRVMIDARNESIARRPEV